MKTVLIASLAVAAGISVAAAAENKSDKPLTERTAESLEKAGEKTKEAGRAVMDTTKKTVNKLTDAVTPDADARKVEVKLAENRLDMPKHLKTGKTGFIVHNTGKEKHSFEIQGEGIDKKFMIGLAPDETKVLHVDLKLGTYKAFCPEKGSEHEGMSSTLTVK